MRRAASSIGARVRVIAHGAVQGVGFRPFVFRLANELGLFGWVLNSSRGVVIEVEGRRDLLELFLRRLNDERPPSATIVKLEASFSLPVGYETFEIRRSDGGGERTARVLPDLAVCPECVADIFDPANRRYRYPFTNCTWCGPRFSIVESMPYDRSATTMRRFAMCADCRREYESPSDRRFHAQPNACAACGPQVELWAPDGAPATTAKNAISRAADAIRSGRILALKGLGGFQLLVDAGNGRAVRELRRRKHREEKPFAVMFRDLDGIAAVSSLSPEEKKLLRSRVSPIVLVRRHEPGGSVVVSPAVAPDNPLLGVMLPTTPLHALLMDELDCPIVATSGNVSDEPICTEEREALRRLGGIADLFLVHNRPIARAMDDSVVRMALGRPLVLRAARGLAPVTISLDQPLPPVLAVGGHLKNTVAMTVGDSVVVSQHVGDLGSPLSAAAFVRAGDSLKALYNVRPGAVACDAHPDYFSTRQAESLPMPRVKVQHHHAHVVSCMADNGLTGSALGVSWDGSGYGPDGTVWGGEFLKTTWPHFRRIARFRPFALPGGEKAVREPRRSAFGVLYEIFGEGLLIEPGFSTVQAFSESERKLLRSMIRRGVNSPLTSSVGRLFDAVASLTGVRQACDYEAQAAMALEFIADPTENRAYSVFVRKTGDPSLEIDWEPMIFEIRADLARGASPGSVSARFHNTLAESLVRVAESADEKRVVLSGGCFQNVFLLERCVRRLREEGFEAYWPKVLPPNDGGLSAGQAIVAASSGMTAGGA